MNDLTNALYEFVTARRMGRIFDDPEYHSITASVQNKENRLRELLDRDGNRLLTDLMNEQALQNAIELEAIFQATVTLCRELGQMVRWAAFTPAQAPPSWPQAFSLWSSWRLRSSSPPPFWPRWSFLP